MTKTYEEHAHAVQSAIEFSPNKRQLEPKHLRVGIDMQKADTLGLVRLLIEKGVFTCEEYAAAVTSSAAEEVEFQKKRLAAEMGMDPDKIKLA